MTEIIDFDWEFYLLFNDDIIPIYGDNKYAATLHYNIHGYKENRVYNIDTLFKAFPHMIHFDWEYYREHNEDLQHINNRYHLINHYLKQGYREKRRINFNTSIYPYFNFNKCKVLENQPKITIIMPVYNRCELLKQAIDCILNQTYENIELIIINDNSTDESMTIISQYIDFPNVIILCNNENYGCYTSLNLALNLSNGDYITTHGSDDISFQDRYMKIITEMITNDLLMCGTFIFRSHFPKFDFDISDVEGIFTKIITQNLLNKNHTSECCKSLVSLGTLVYKKSVFDKLGIYKNVRKGGDMIFFEQYLKHYEDVTFNELDCSHRYLTKYNKGKHYKIIDEIMYMSAEMNGDNITSQKIPFNINDFR